MPKIPGKTDKTVTEESKAQNSPLGYHGGEGFSGQKDMPDADGQLFLTIPCTS
jgi:hypothetical protein